MQNTSVDTELYAMSTGMRLFMPSSTALSASNADLPTSPCPRFYAECTVWHDSNDPRSDLQSIAQALFVPSLVASMKECFLRVLRHPGGIFASFCSTLEILMQSSFVISAVHP